MPTEGQQILVYHTYWQQDPWVLISSLASNLESVTSLHFQMPKWVGARWGVAGVLLGVRSYPDGRDFTSLHISGLKGKISQGQGQGCLGLTSTGCPSLLFQVTRRCTSFPKKPHRLVPVYVTVLSIELPQGMLAGEMGRFNE